MKKITLLTAIAMIAFTVSTFGQASATTAGTSTATIVEPLEITAVDPLAFGILDARVGGDLIIAGDGTVTDDAEMVLDGENPTAASFSVTGAADTPFVVLPITDIQLFHTDDATTMDLKSFTTSVVPELDAAGAATFKVGATLTVGQDQLAGEYDGTFSVTVQYL